MKSSAPQESIFKPSSSPYSTHDEWTWSILSRNSRKTAIISSSSDRRVPESTIPFLSSGVFRWTNDSGDELGNVPGPVLQLSNPL